MRTYLLALTKYGLTATVVCYTVLAFVLLFSKRRNANGPLSVVQSAMIFLYQFIAYVTLAVAMEDFRYVFLLLFQAVIFFGAIILYRMMYQSAHMPLFHNVCMLMSIGLVIQSRLAFSNAVHQLIIAAAGLVIAIALPMLREQFYLLKLPGLLYAFAGVIILAVVMLLGSATLGANITWTIAGLTFQPSEFVKILYLLFLASTLKEVRDMKGLFVIALFAAAHVLILVGSTDLGSGLIFYVMFLFMVYLATDKWLYLVGGFAACAIGSVVMYNLFDHIQKRVAAFLDPWSYIDDIGYQITQSLFAIGAGGAFGSGLGQGTPDKIPFVESDFVYAGLCEEMGLIIGVCVVLLCLNCFLLMMILAGGFADKFYRLLAYGMAIEYGFQTFLTLGGETKFIPLTGVTLPFISYGGSSILTTTMMFTMVEVMYMLRGEKIEKLRAERARAQHRKVRSAERERREVDREIERRQDRFDYTSPGPAPRGVRASYPARAAYGGTRSSGSYQGRSYYRDSYGDYDSGDSESYLDDDMDERYESGY